MPSSRILGPLLAGALLSGADAGAPAPAPASVAPGVRQDPREPSAPPRDDSPGLPGTLASDAPSAIADPEPSASAPDLVARHRGRLKLSSSSTYQGWPGQRAVDGDLSTSWFSGTGDSAGQKKSPWVQLSFPVPVTVREVEVLGNREAAWKVGYTIHLARLELYGAKGQRLWTGENEGWNRLQDMRFKLKRPVPDVRQVRLTSLADEGAQNSYGDIAIAEIRVR